MGKRYSQSAPETEFQVSNNEIACIKCSALPNNVYSAVDYTVLPAVRWFFCQDCEEEWEYVLSDGELEKLMKEENVIDYNEAVPQSQSETKPENCKHLRRYARGNTDGCLDCKAVGLDFPGYEQAKKMGITYPGAPDKSGSFEFGGKSTSSWSSSCTHAPTKVIEGKDWSVWVGKKSDVKNSAGEFDVVMNLTFDSIKQEHVIPIPELERWEYGGGKKFKEMQMDWPDMGVVSLPLRFWKDVLAYIKHRKQKLLIFCQGGHGRTGTALASLLVAYGYTPDDAIKWVKSNYCSKAIETQGQEKYIRDLVKVN